MFFERAEGGEKAVLIHIDSGVSDSVHEDAEEFVQLCESAGLVICDLVVVPLKAPSPKAFVGEGKLQEIASLMLGFEADVLLFNATLSPSQQRNIEKAVERRVIDRTGLILDIFAQRARTHEGKLQVELAQLQYVSTRLVRGWTHLERQKGGIGLRGPGETQLETDRRLIRIRIKSIEKRLEKVKKQREQGRRGREKAEIPTIAVVGYTNAGKSTLFNQLTQSEVYAADQLFATLDPTLRRINVPGFGPIVLADTVGFIRNLPHKLVDAFKATLEETVQADLLVHVVDASSDERLSHIDQVNEVLKEIGADAKQQLLVYNKIDLLEQVEPRRQAGDEFQPDTVWVSAKAQQGFSLLFDALVDKLSAGVWVGQLLLPPAEGELRSALYASESIIGEIFDAKGNACLDVRINKNEIPRLERRLKIDWQRFVVDNGRFDLAR